MSNPTQIKDEVLGLMSDTRVWIAKREITHITKEQFTKESFYDYFDCYLKLIDINPQFVKQYMNKTYMEMNLTFMKIQI